MTLTTIDATHPSVTFVKSENAFHVDHSDLTGMGVRGMPNSIRLRNPRPGGTVTVKLHLTHRSPGVDNELLSREFRDVTASWNDLKPITLFVHND